MEQGLNKGIFHYEYKVYHGVEYQEDEFYDQLNDFITPLAGDSYSYTNCVGKTITSYGFISVSKSFQRIQDFCNCWIFNKDHVDYNKFHLPLKEKVALK